MTDISILNMGRFYLLYQRTCSSNFRILTKEDINQTKEEKLQYIYWEKTRSPMLVFPGIFIPDTLHGGGLFISRASSDKLLNIIAHYITEFFHLMKVYILLHRPIDLSPHLSVSLYVHTPWFLYTCIKVPDTITPPQDIYWHPKQSNTTNSQHLPNPYCIYLNNSISIPFRGTTKYFYPTQFQCAMNT